MPVTRLDLLQTTLETGLVPLFDTDDPGLAVDIVASCVEAGARVVEFRQRRPRAHSVFTELVRQCAASVPTVILGAGSIVDAATAALYIASGAAFIVSPMLSPQIAELCNRRKIAYFPGCATVTEISDAEALGVEICKIFPAAELGGPGFIRSVLAPMPWTRLMPTGGVDATEKSVHDWVLAGAACLAMGSGLITDSMIDRKDIKELPHRVGEILGWIRSARSGL